MTIDSDKILHDLLNSLDSLEGIRPGEIPNIALYMDQVTTFMDAQLASSRRFESDKVLTKTMINNYAKNKLLPPPVKKKYSPEHMMLLVFIYYFKNILSITDIQTLLAPITDRYFGTESGFSIKDIYDEIFQMEKEEIASVKEDLLKKADVSKSMFGSSPEEDREFLQLFSFICLLSCFLMLSCTYEVVAIDGDYAHLRRNDIEPEDNETKLVARALLPPEIMEGSILKYEMLQYEIIG